MRFGYPQLLVVLQFGLIVLMILFVIYLQAFFSLLALFIFSLGIAMGIWAIKMHPSGNFRIVPELKEDCTLVTKGIYRHIRHPMYASVILMQLGIVLFHPTWYQWLMWLLLIGVLWLKASREERLWITHDTCYKEYKARTKYFIPYIL